MNYGSKLKSAEDIAAAVQELGFLPFFRNAIPGFSIEDRTPLSLWFTDQPGPWDWKGPIIQQGSCAYGKFFRGKAVFVSLDWFPDLVNYRRDGYDYDARCEDGLAPWHDQRIYEKLSGGGMLSKALKSDCGYGKEGLKGFDQAITRLQMQTYVCVENFEYALDKHGAPYGWGVARYNTPEVLYGKKLVRSAYKRDPAESYERIKEHLLDLLPATEAEVKKLIK